MEKQEKGYNLFLDDVRSPENCTGYVFSLGIRPDIYINREWVIVRNYTEFTKYIEENGLPELFSTDHDLSDEHYAPIELYDEENEFNQGRIKEWESKQVYKEKTVYECAMWLIEYCMANNKKLPEFVVHSMNPVGRERIKNLLKDFYKIQQSV
jgi:hypothetical protein